MESWSGFGHLRTLGSRLQASHDPSHSARSDTLTLPRAIKTTTRRIFRLIRSATITTVLVCLPFAAHSKDYYLHLGGTSTICIDIVLTQKRCDFSWITGHGWQHSEVQVSDPTGVHPIRLWLLEASSRLRVHTGRRSPVLYYCKLNGRGRLGRSQKPVVTSSPQRTTLLPEQRQGRLGPGESPWRGR